MGTCEAQTKNEISPAPLNSSLFHKTNYTEIFRFVCHHLLALSSPNRWGCLHRLSDGAHHEVYESPLLLIHQTWQKNRQVQKWVGDPWVYKVELKEIHKTSRSGLKGLYLLVMFRVRGSSADFWHKILVMELRVVQVFLFQYSSLLFDQTHILLSTGMCVSFLLCLTTQNSRSDGTTWE